MALAREFLTAVEDGSYADRGWPRSMYGVSKVRAGGDGGGGGGEREGRPLNVPPSALSQLAEIAWSHALHRQLAAAAPGGIDVLPVCPGYCATAMSSFRGHRTPAKGAETPVWLALREVPAAAAPGTAGGFGEAAAARGLWYDKAVIAW
jgi:NAD(P)-dependent dehydrogenase (short-subunit alcohol dehydrogenase family)